MSVCVILERYFDKHFVHEIKEGVTLSQKANIF